jgi:hypothetical protein
MALTTTLLTASDPAALQTLVQAVVTALSVASVTVDYAIDSTSGTYSVIILNE